MDAVVNLAFNHDFSKFAQNGEDERKAIEALGSVLEPGKLLVVTSGTGLTSGGPGHVRTESDPPVSSTAIPRQPEQAAKGAAERGVRVGIVRLPQVHDTRKQGLVSFLTQMAREKGVSAYVGDGANRWAAAPLRDVAHSSPVSSRGGADRPGRDGVSRGAGRRRSAARDRRDARQRAEGACGVDRHERRLRNTLGGLRTSPGWICRLRVNGRARR